MVVQQMKEMGLIPMYHSTDYSNKYPHYWFEENDINENRVWLRQQMPTCVGVCLLYFLFVMYGPKLMKNRKPFDLQIPLTIWNFSFAFFSFFTLFRALPTFLENLIAPDGFHKSACGPIATNHTLGFYAWMFTLSKMAELGDTVFIVLRKKQLLFLHWFHHMTVVYMTFFVFSEGEPFSSWPAILNCSVHALMYTYYGIMSLKIKVPKKLAMMLTTIQLLQFVAIFGINMYGVAVLAGGGECQRTPASIKLYGFAASSYGILFLRYFYNAYIAKRKTKTI